MTKRGANSPGNLGFPVIYPKSHHRHTEKNAENLKISKWLYGDRCLFLSIFSWYLYIYIIRYLHFWETTILWFPFGPLPGPASKIAPCATLPEPAQCAEMVAKRQHIGKWRRKLECNQWNLKLSPETEDWTNQQSGFGPKIGIQQPGLRKTAEAGNIGRLILWSESRSKRREDVQEAHPKTT